MTRIRTLIAALTTAGLLVALLAPFTPLIPASPAQALSGSDFNPGNIISDSVFFNTTTMNADQIQSFFASQEGGCTASNGYPCLKDFRQDTFSRAASAGRCGAYPGAGGESAATILFKVSQICGINPQVLIVTLEKEQGLVSSTAPTSWKYQAAMGYGCPDTAPCDAQYYGFYNQVYKAAWQFAEYTAEPDYWRYHPGNVAVQYNPNAACGAPIVNIQNQATANLYNYTPYQPNAAALRNLTGIGDSCSAYGNRNFWVTFNNWFGSTQTGGNFFRTASNPNVYVVSGNVKHLVASGELLSALSPLGPVGIVSDDWLNSKTTGAQMGRIVGNSSGDIYFLDQGRKFHFTSCDQVIAWGIACANYVPLTDAQVGVFAGSASMTNAVHVWSNYYYKIAGGKRAQAVDATALNAALPGGITELSDYAVTPLPLTTPILRDNVAVRSGQSDSYGIYYSGAMTPVSGDLYRGSRLATAYPAVTFEPPSFAMIPTRAAMTGVITAGSGNSVLTPSGRLPIGSATWGITPTTVTSTVYNALPSDTANPVGSTVFVTAPGTPSVYEISGSVKRIIPEWSDYLAVSAGVSDPTIRTISLAALSQIPNGPATLAAGSYIADPTGRSFLVDGSGKKLYVPSPAVVNGLGLGAPRAVSQAVSDSLTSNGTIGAAVTCGSTNYYGTGDGILRTISSAIATAYGITGFTALDAATCAKLRTSSTAITRFGQSATGQVYVADSGTVRWVASGAALTALGGSASTITPFPNVGRLTAGSPAVSGNLAQKPAFLQPAGSPVVYVLDAGSLHQLMSWSDYLAASSGATDKTIYSVAADLLSAVPLGSPYIAPGTIIRAADQAEVYLVDGSSKIHITSGNLLDAGGLVPTIVSSADVAGLTTASGSLSPWLACPSGTILAIGGAWRPLTGNAATQYASSVKTTVQASTCAGLRPVAAAPPAFVRDPSGAIYQMTNGTKQHILSPSRYAALGGNASNTLNVSAYSASLFPNGPDLP